MIAQQQIEQRLLPQLVVSQRRSSVQRQQLAAQRHTGTNSDSDKGFLLELVC